MEGLLNISEAVLDRLTMVTLYCLVRTYIQNTQSTRENFIKNIYIMLISN